MNQDVTQLLSALEQGDPHAAAQLLPLVYDELRKLAAQRMAQERPGQTLLHTSLAPVGKSVIDGSELLSRWDRLTGYPAS